MIGPFYIYANVNILKPWYSCATMQFYIDTFICICTCTCDGIKLDIDAFTLSWKLLIWQCQVRPIIVSINFTRITREYTFRLQTMPSTFFFSIVHNTWNQKTGKSIELVKPNVYQLFRAYGHWIDWIDCCLYLCCCDCVAIYTFPLVEWQGIGQSFLVDSVSYTSTFSNGFPAVKNNFCTFAAVPELCILEFSFH